METEEQLCRGVGRSRKPTAAPATKTFLPEVEELKSRTVCNYPIRNDEYSYKSVEKEDHCHDRSPEFEPRLSCLFEGNTRVAVSEHVQHIQKRNSRCECNQNTKYVDGVKPFVKDSIGNFGIVHKFL